MIGKVETLGSFWELTAPYVALAEKAEQEKEIKRKRQLNRFLLEEEKRDNSYDDYAQSEEKEVSLVEQMKEVKALLKKAKIDAKFFPFKPELNKEGEIVGFVPKGKNKEEIQKNIEEYKEKLEEALEKGRITQEEFDKLNENLEDLMKENDIELEENEDLNITNDEIEENLQGLIAHNFGNEENFEKFCEKYESLDFNERKDCLTELNSKINSHLGISGELKFSSNPNLKFENSFFDKGYYLTEKEVETQDLKPMLYSMMEKSMIREKEIKYQEKISAQKKRDMHKKIMEERERKYKQYKDKQERKFAEKTRQRVRSMFGND